MEVLQQTIDDIKTIIANPRIFFTSKQHSTARSALYVVFFTIIQSSLSLLFATEFYQAWTDASVALTGKVLPGLQFTGTGYTLLFGALALISIITTMIIMIISYAYLRFVGGSKTSYADNAQVIAYSATPSYLLGWIPYVSLAGHMWSLALAVYGLHIKHPMPTWRFAIVLATPLLALTATALYLMGY